MTQPTFPLIGISEDNSLDLIPAENSFSKVATSALLDPNVFKGTFLYDKTGYRWTYRLVSDKFKNTFFTKVLAWTFYNPLLAAKVVWTNDGTYQLEELKEKIKFCVDKDDDIITQFEEADIINPAVDNAVTFDDIVSVLNKYVFAVNEAELWKEQEARSQ